jgi:DNA helicase-2/ATP-dependent DNA helicase PcrA
VAEPLTAEVLQRLLNPEQYEAAVTTEGPLLILAGAGSGKTRVLVHRTAYLLDSRRAEPWQIFMVTFTNKAAGEMRERLEKLYGPEIRSAWIGTFHALSARILRLEGYRLGFGQSFSIYDADDSRRLIKKTMDAMNIDSSSRGIPLGSVVHEIDRAKNAGLGPKQFAEQAQAFDTPIQKISRAVYQKYQASLRRANAMDFGDLLLLAVELLKHHPEARHRFQRRFRYVMVDEFQDTNHVQFELLQLLSAEHGNLAVVGDDDQAIYRWRGADVKHILGFGGTYPNAKVVKLERNYRSTGNILAAANAVIRKNKQRHDKALKTEAESGPPLGLALVNRSEEEALLVARAIGARLRKGLKPEAFAILYRQNAQSRLFEDTLRRERIPFVVIGGTSFYERAEVKDVLAYLRLLANPASVADFDRIANVPPRGLGDKSLAKLREAAEAEGLEGAAQLSVSQERLQAAGLSDGAIKKLRSLGRLLSELSEAAETESATEVARKIIERTEYLKYLSENDPATADDRIANVEELVTSIAELEEQAAKEPVDDELGLGLAGARTPLQAFLDQAALVSPDDQAERGAAVSMLTLHSAKGLEFDVVFMVGMEEQTFPSKRAVDSEEGPEAMEEERRLCYVGMTRARKELLLTGARLRRIYGKEEVRWPSRFLGELPDGRVANLTVGDGRPSAPATLPSSPRGGGVRVEYDDDLPPKPGWSPMAPARTQLSDGEFGVGARVAHNTFGVGVVESADGQGPNARLTIRFPAGTKTVVARFVKSAKDS